MNSPPEDIPEAYYGRLCPADERGHDEAKLCDLAERMKDSSARRRGSERLAAMRSGYVYLGQFLGHDLTHDRSSVANATAGVDKTPNYRTPRLDLDHLYGKDPSAVPHFYHNGRFKLGHTTAVVLPNGEERRSCDDDLLRMPDGTPQIIDDRNDENLVIAQLQVLFSKLHNRFMDLLEESPQLSPGGGTLFDQARRLVTWHYQWIIWNDFLPQIVQARALEELASCGFRFYQRAFTPDDAPLALPIEFTLAAFRFGHSMVQDGYILNRDTRVRTETLIRMTKRGGGIGTQPAPAPDGWPTLPASFVINWDSFFAGSRPGQLNRGKQIDTFIHEDLYGLPPPTVAICSGQLSLQPQLLRSLTSHPLRLPELTLRRGAKVRLPTGENFARAFNYDPLPGTQIALPADQEFFDDPEFRERTPLWYYFLREAAVERVMEPEFPRGLSLEIQKLGTIGSRLIAEVLLQVLNADGDSIRNKGCQWRPPKLVFGSSQKPRAMISMAVLIEFANSRNR